MCKAKVSIFLRKINGRYSDSIAKWFKKCCAILNKYGETGFSETERNINFAKTAVEKSSTVCNSLYDRLKEAGRLRLAPSWKKMDGKELPDFPQLSFHELEEVSLGGYQMAEA